VHKSPWPSRVPRRKTPLNRSQEGPRCNIFAGMVEIDAKKHSFFKDVIEQRNVHASSSALHYWLKILANSGSDGEGVLMPGIGRNWQN
jgi:hypothetical protein